MKIIVIVSALSLMSLSMYAMERDEETAEVLRAIERMSEIGKRWLSPEQLSSIEAHRKNAQQRFEAARTPEEEAAYRSMVEQHMRKMATMQARREKEDFLAARQRMAEIEQGVLSRMSPEEWRAYETDLQERLQKIRSATTPEQKAEAERVFEETRRQIAETEKKYGMLAVEKPS